MTRFLLASILAGLATGVLAGNAPRPEKAPAPRTAEEPNAEAQELIVFTTTRPVSGIFKSRFRKASCAPRRSTTSPWRSINLGSRRMTARSSVTS